MYKRAVLNCKHRFVVKCGIQTGIVFQQFQTFHVFFDPLTLPVAGFPGRTSNILYPDIQADFWMQLDSKSIRSSIFAQKTSSFGRLRLSHLRSPCVEDPSIFSRPMSLDCVDCRSHIEAVWRAMKNNKQIQTDIPSFPSHALHGPVILFCAGTVKPTRGQVPNQTVCSLPFKCVFVAQSGTVCTLRTPHLAQFLGEKP